MKVEIGNEQSIFTRSRDAASESRIASHASLMGSQSMTLQVLNFDDRVEGRTEPGGCDIDRDNIPRRRLEPKIVEVALAGDLAIDRHRQNYEFSRLGKRIRFVLDEFGQIADYERSAPGSLR